MQTLKSILKETGIDSKDALRAYIKKNKGVKSNIPLIVFSSNDLGLDSESRVYDDVLSYKRMIVDVPFLKVRNSQNILFQDCVFTGEVVIGHNIDGIVKILFDCCVFCGPLTVSIPNGEGNISIYSVNAPNIILHNIKCNELHISFCHIGHLLLADSQVREFFTFCNFFEALDIGPNRFDKVSFSHRQVVLSAQLPLANKPKMAKIVREFNVFQFAPKPDYSEMSNAEGNALRSQTFDFLATYSDVGLNRNAAGHLKYLQSLTCQPNWIFRQLQRVLGAFVKPERVLYVIMFTIAIFGCIFALPVFRFILPGPEGSVIRSLSLFEAFYFSGASFMTISYGDIAPLAWARFCAIFEGLLGIVLSSALVVSIVRKYVEK